MKINAKRIYFYLGVLIIVILLAFADKQKSLLQQKVEEIGSINNIYMYLYGLLRLVVFGLLGALLAVEYYFIQRKKTGKWTFNKARFFILVLPCFLIGITSTVFPLAQVFILNLVNNFFSRFSDYSTLLIMVQVVFGYSLVTSFRKRESIENVNEIGQINYIEQTEFKEEPIEPKNPAE